MDRYQRPQTRFSTNLLAKLWANWMLSVAQSSERTHCRPNLMVGATFFSFFSFHFRFIWRSVFWSDVVFLWLLWDQQTTICVCVSQWHKHDRITMRQALVNRMELVRAFVFRCAKVCVRLPFAGAVITFAKTFDHDANSFHAIVDVSYYFSIIFSFLSKYTHLRLLRSLFKTSFV